jgi:hypothetical protein
MKHVARLVFRCLPLVFFLSACHARPTPQQIYSADYGSYPRDYESIIRTHYSTYLFDPYTAVYTFRSPTQAWRSSFSNIQYGWVVCGTINAKNRFGGYVGAKPFYVFIRNGAILVNFEEFMAAEGCKQTYNN